MATSTNTEAHLSEVGSSGNAGISNGVNVQQPIIGQLPTDRIIKNTRQNGSCQIVINLTPFGFFWVVVHCSA